MRKPQKTLVDVEQSVLLPNNLVDEDDIDVDDPSVLPESISISRIEDLLAQMRFHEVPKRAQFSISFEIANGLSIGVKGYALLPLCTTWLLNYSSDMVW